MNKEKNQKKHFWRETSFRFPYVWAGMSEDRKGQADAWSSCVRLSPLQSGGGVFLASGRIRNAAYRPARASRKAGDGRISAPMLAMSSRLNIRTS